MSFFRRLSRSERDRDRDNDRDRDDHRLSHHSNRGPISPTSPPTSYNMPNGLPQHGQDQHHSRPASSTNMSDGSYDFASHHQQSTTHNPNITSPTNQQNTSHRFAANPQPPSSSSTSRPISHALPIPAAGAPISSNTNAASGSGSATLSSLLSRTDQVVLRYFWEAKAQENLSRDLHFLKFPTFGNAPGDRELVPFCEIYALVKNSKGAEIVGLGTLGGGGGSGAGTFIGFELFSSAQLHIDLSDQWTVPISHHRVSFKSFDALFRQASTSSSSSSSAGGIAEQVRSWPKPLTIEFLEDMYARRWARDLNALCWESREVRELGGGGGATGGPGGGNIDGGNKGPGKDEDDEAQEEFVH